MVNLFVYIKITRPVNILITYLVVLVAILISQSRMMDIFTYIFVPLSASLIAAAGNIINDIYDIETDKVSHRERVLVVGTMTIKSAWIYNFLLNASALFITLFFIKSLFVIAVLTIVLLYFYSTHLKKLPLLGNITIAVLTAAAFIYGGLAAENVYDAIIPAVFAFMINLIRELVKDIQDIQGDSKIGYQTFPIRYGVLRTKKLIIALSVMLVLMTLYPFFMQVYKIEYFIIIMLVVNPIIIYLIKLLHSENDSIVKANIILKLNMIAGLIAVYFGQ